jgi:antitoxin HicB
MERGEIRGRQRGGTAASRITLRSIRATAVTTTHFVTLMLYQSSLLKDRVMDARRTFAVVLEPEEEGGFTVRVPAFPEIVTYGKDEREALAMAEDAIRPVIADSLARGEPVPNGEPPRIREVTVTLAA